MDYNTKILDYYSNRDRVGSLDSSQKNVGSGLVGSPSCGDGLKLDIEVNDQNIITKVRYKIFGCGTAYASSALAAELLEGKSIDEAYNVKDVEIANTLSLPPIKLHCSVLAEAGIKKAIANYKEKNNLI